ILVGASGFSYEEAAAICDCAVGTIKSRVNRARTRLSDLLSIDGADDFGPDHTTRAILSAGGRGRSPARRHQFKSKEKISPRQTRARARACLKTVRQLTQGTVGERPRMRATTAEITNRMIATKKMIFAISTAKPAIPPKPSTAAISATTRNVKAQPSMAVLRHCQNARSCAQRCSINGQNAGMFRRRPVVGTVRTHLTDLRMHILGEPVGRHVMAQPARLRLAVDEGPRGRELIAESDIVDEAGDVGV